MNTPDLNSSDLVTQLPMPTHFAPAMLSPRYFQFTIKVASTLTGKWCAHCAKDTHNDAECWSTRAVQP